MSQFDLVDASFCVQPILEEVALLIELLVDVGCLQQVILHELGRVGSRLHFLSERIGDVESGRARITERAFE